MLVKAIDITMAEATKTPDLSALSGKIKLVLSSFPQWDLQPPSERDRTPSDFEQPQTAFVLGPVQDCKPAVVVAQQELSDEESQSSASSDSDQSDLEPVPAPIIAASEPASILVIPMLKPQAAQEPRGGAPSSPVQPHGNATISIDTKAENSSPAPKTASASNAPFKEPMMIVTSHPPIREPATKVPIMVTRSEDVSSVREKPVKTHTSVADHKTQRACHSCILS